MRGHGIEIGALALLAATGWAGMASAQTPDIPTVVSPLRVETDHNNVNIISGKTSIDGPALGVPAAPNLRFDRVQNAAPYVRGTITGPPGGPFTGSYSVHAGGAASEAFTCPDLDCASVTGTGSTLQTSNSGRGAAVYRQAGSGVRYQFSVLNVSAFGSPNSLMLYYASTALWPNGETITYSYDTASLPGQPSVTYRRPIRLQSNLGYHITISYHPGELGTAEWNSPLQATLYADAAPTVPLQRLTYNADGSTITDVGGRTWTCANCRNAMGGTIEVASGSLQLPGEGGPALQVAQAPPPPDLPGAQFVGSVNRDGVAWNYAYTNIRPTVGGSLIYDRVTVTGPNGFNQVYAITQSDQRNVIDSMTDSLGRITDFTFDAAYRPTRIVYPELNEVGVTYDPQGNIVERRAKARPGTGLSDIVQTAQYPDAPGGIPNMCHVECWRPLSSRDALNRQTDYLYNASGQLTQQDDPADAQGVRRRTIIAYATSPGGLSRRSVVRVCGATTTCGTNAEIRTEYEYWGETFLPTVERRIDASSGTAVTLTTAYDYDPAGRLLSVDGPLPGSDDTTFNRYDVHGRKTWDIGPRAANGVRIATVTSYRPADDKVLSVETGTIPAWDSPTLAPLRRADATYDSRRNPIRETVSAGGTTYAVTDKSFDDRGQLLCTAVRMNPAAFAQEPGACAPTTYDPDKGRDRITQNIYDAAGQRLQLREGVGTTEVGTEATWAYGANGQITTVIDGNGNRAELRYDGHGRQDRWTFPSTTRPAAYNDSTPATALATAGSVNAADYEAYGYDPVGNRTSLRKRDGSTLTYQYDALNRMIVKVVPERAGLTAAQTRDVYYGYDLRNLQLFARFDSASGEGITNVYNGFGWLSSSTTNMGGVARTLGYGYDYGARRTHITHPDGNYFQSWYDGLNRPFFNMANGATGFGYLHIFFNNHGGPSWMGRGNGNATNFTYDGLQRVASMGHDFVSGDVNWTYGRNPANQLNSVARDNDTYAWAGHVNVGRNYTTNGLNQYTAAGPANFAYDANGNLTADGTRTFLYDVENRMVGASGGVALSYDPLGRLYQVTGSSGTTTFLYDGDALVAEYNGTTLLRRHVHNVGADVPVVTFEGTGLATPRYLFADHQGSIIAWSDAGGSVLGINSYDEYGIPAATNMGRFQYTGQIWLPELGMYHYKARVYSPTLGRFMQTDPIGYDDQFNLYAYVGNDPVNRTDPTGKSIYGPDDRTQRRMVERYINARAAGSGHRYAFRGRDNQLTRQREAGSRGATGTRIAGTSPYYARRLDQAIASDARIDVRVQQTLPDQDGRTVDIDQKWGGGVTVPGQGRNSTIYMTGNGIRGVSAESGKTIIRGPADILAHEFVAHAIPRAVGSDTGNGVANENKVRVEAGLPLRAPEPGHVE